MPKAAKVGDIATDHDGFAPTAVTSGSPDVFIDHQPAARVGDPVAPHAKPNHPPHGRTIAIGNPNILVNGLPLAETGSSVSCGGVVVGSGTVSTGYDNGISIGPGVSIGGGVTMNGKNELCEVVNGEARALSLIEILELTKQEWLQIIEPVRQALVNKNMAPPHAYQPPAAETTAVASSQPRHLVNPFDTNGGAVIHGAPDYDNVDPLLPVVTPEPEDSTAWLTVSEGQLTFDAEGSDEETLPSGNDNPFFSRKFHVPNNGGADQVIDQSGITVGRGLDIGSPPVYEHSDISRANGYETTLDLEQVFTDAGLAQNVITWLMGGVGLQRAEAYNYLENASTEGLTDDDLTLTRKQQHDIFERVYQFNLEKTHSLMCKADVRRLYGDVQWDNIPQEVKDVLVDITFRGDSTGSDSRTNTRSHYVPTLVTGARTNDYSAFEDIMDDERLWRTQQGVQLTRFNERINHL